ncbi:hypothetical protein CSKR_203634 [Clonorchis sinensis]|uniref:Uncharacterized protein n=1 Tax=Clonorchis sinensis TaxID=79923 RepID=A0A8T1N065_CLOSI|nr:hypothetical protein CSKR_203634 [Clonorchis sinensis]
MSEDAFPDLHDGQREDKILEQIIVGTRAPKLRERFLGSPPHSVAAALQVANQVEDIMGVLERDREPNTAHFDPVRIQQQHSRQWTPNRGRPYHPVPPRPNRPNFRPTLHYPAPTNIPRWPTPSRDCPYCQRFGARARTCGHNGPQAAAVTRLEHEDTPEYHSEEIDSPPQ